MRRALTRAVVALSLVVVVVFSLLCAFVQPYPECYQVRARGSSRG